MLTKILIPTDGSNLGTVSALEGVSMAQKVGAEVVGIFVSRELQNQLFNFADHRPKNYPTQEEYKQAVDEAGAVFLKPVKDAAESAGVPYSGVIKISNATARTIVQTAEELGCSMIFMGSHGCAGWGHNLLGSVATKVLSSTQIPTLIYRLKKEQVPEEEKVRGYKSPMGI